MVHTLLQDNVSLNSFFIKLIIMSTSVQLYTPSEQALHSLHNSLSFILFKVPKIDYALNKSY